MGGVFFIHFYCVFFFLSLSLSCRAEQDAHDKYVAKMKENQRKLEEEERKEQERIKAEKERKRKEQEAEEERRRKAKEEEESSSEEEDDDDDDEDFVCSGCGKPIDDDDDGIEALGKAWHEKCFGK